MLQLTKYPQLSLFAVGGLEALMSVCVLSRFYKGISAFAKSYYGRISKPMRTPS